MTFNIKGRIGLDAPTRVVPEAGTIKTVNVFQCFARTGTRKLVATPKLTDNVRLMFDERHRGEVAGDAFGLVIRETAWRRLVIAS